MKKIENFNFFKILSLKIKNLLVWSCPHIWLCIPSPRIFQKIFFNGKALYEQCELEVIDIKNLFDSKHGLLYFLWIAHLFQKFQNAIFFKIFEIPAIG